LDDLLEAIMTAAKPEPKSEKSEHDWSKTATAIGGLTVALATLLTALYTIGVIGKKEPTPTPVVTSAPAARVTETQASQLLVLEDDFSNPKSGWDRGADSDAEWGYQDDEYRIVVHAKDMTVWANTHERHDLTNLVMVVEARGASGPDDNQYGVILRYVDRANSYLFTVSSDGQYSVQMLRDDKWEDLTPWTPSSAVRKGQATNLLRVEARGRELRFTVNEELVATVEDATFASGGIGLVAGSFAQGEVEARFDNLLVRELP